MSFVFLFTIFHGDRDNYKKTRFQASENTSCWWNHHFLRLFCCWIFFTSQRWCWTLGGKPGWRPYGREKNVLFFFIDNVSFFIHWLRYVVFLEKQYFKKTYYIVYIYVLVFECTFTCTCINPKAKPICSCMLMSIGTIFIYSYIYIYYKYALIQLCSSNVSDVSVWFSSPG